MTMSQKLSCASGHMYFRFRSSTRTRISLAMVDEGRGRLDRGEWCRWWARVYCFQEALGQESSVQEVPGALLPARYSADTPLRFCRPRQLLVNASQKLQNSDCEIWRSEAPSLLCFVNYALLFLSKEALRVIGRLGAHKLAGSIQGGRRMS